MQISSKPISVFCMLRYNTSLAIRILSQYFSNQQCFFIFCCWNILKFVAGFSTIRWYPRTERVRNTRNFNFESRKERENLRNLSLVGKSKHNGLTIIGHENVEYVQGVVRCRDDVKCRVLSSGSVYYLGEQIYLLLSESAFHSNWTVITILGLYLTAKMTARLYSRK